MQIHYITPAIFAKNNEYTIKNKEKLQQNSESSISPIYKGKLPSTKEYLSFMGGYSLNLAETIANLDKLAEKGNIQIYPKNIREWAGMILETGNKAKYTLIDIHKKYYESIKNFNSLEEVKRRFPEFAEVISDSEVEFSKNSFGEDVKSGKLEYFDKDEDLALQLLKLYYGEGFSLNDLKKYANGKDIYYTMKKFKIPTQSRDYGHILKFSDTEYNTRLTAEMTYKRRLALDKKARELGEPIYIPRGPLSKEHREHISEGLKRYYQENPERIYDMSEKMKGFYRENPEKSKELTRVLNKAWNIFGADRIKSELSKFMKSRGFNSFKPENNPVDMPKEQSKAMKQFWGVNEWARKSFSKNMEYAWKKVKEENETFYTIRTVPTLLTQYIAKKANYPLEKLNFDTKFNPYLETSNIDEFAQELMTKYTDNTVIANVMADTYQIAIIKVFGDLHELDLKSKPKIFKELYDYALLLSGNNIEKSGKAYKIQSTNEAQNDFISLYYMASQSKNQEIIDILNNSLDESFQMAMSYHNFILK